MAAPVKWGPEKGDYEHDSAHRSRPPAILKVNCPAGRNPAKLPAARRVVAPYKKRKQRTPPGWRNKRKVIPLPRRYIDRIYLREPIPADSYLSALPAVRALGDREHPLLFPADVTFLVGENGTGKSTLLEAVAVACGFNAEGGTRNFDFSTRATHSPLHEYLTVGRTAYPRDGFFLRAESFYNVATNIDEMDEAPSFGPRLIDSYGGVSLHDQSHGESFLALVEHRFGGNGLYLLDEPEAALSPTRMMSLLVLIRNLVKKHSQFIIATHSPILMAYPGACIYQLSQDGIDRVAYRDTEHYQLTRRFLEAPERMIDLLFREE